MDLSLRYPLGDNLALLIAEKVHIGNSTSTNFNITGGSVTNVVGTLNQKVPPAATASTVTRKSGAQTPGLIPPPIKQAETLESKASPHPPQPPRPSSRAKRKSIPRHPETDAEPYDGEISSTPSPPRPAAAPRNRPSTPQQLRNRPPIQQPPPPPPHTKHPPPLPPSHPPPYSNPRKKARYTAPLAPQPQSARQKLLHLQDTVLRDIRYSLAEAHVLCAQLERKIQEVVEDPLVVEGDYMLTVKDETEMDATEKDETEKDETEKDETEKDETEKDETEKDETEKDETEKDE